jgi:hypothetical protein
VFCDAALCSGVLVLPVTDPVGLVPPVPVVALGVDGVVADDSAGALDPVDPLMPVEPAPATFSNLTRWLRNSTSFARIAGSMAAASPVPVVPTAPGVPVGAAGAAGAVWAEASAAGSLVSAPMRAVMFAFTLSYDARHSLFVVISSLKFVMSCEI